jgi:hypothetical protein
MFVKEENTLRFPATGKKGKVENTFKLRYYGGTGNPLNEIRGSGRGEACGHNH